MQDVPLTINLILRRAETVAAHAEVVSIEPAGTRRSSWGEVAERARGIGTVLDQLAVPAAGVVGTFAWNTARHLELYLGVPASGRVLHSANVRLSAKHIAYVINHAGDDLLFVDASLTPLLAPIRERLTSVRQIVVMDDSAQAHPSFDDCPRYEALLADAQPMIDSRIDESTAASICFTSGTTGRPKAVVYSHRSVLLHALNAIGVDSHAISRHDTVLPLTPMFHVNCWGLPYSAALAGAKLVLPGRDTSAEHTAALVEMEGVTVAAGVPTLWIRFADELDSSRRELTSLRRVLSGGAESTGTLIERYTRHGISYFHGWGATEMSPSGSAAVVKPDSDDTRWGPAVAGVELRLRDSEGGLAPWDGVSQGEIEARGPWVAAAYLNPDDDSNAMRFTTDGWFRTGDIGRIDAHGNLEILDRVKDLIKSGGEWISSLELERTLAAHPDIVEAAVIAVPHPEWGERPVALIVTRTGEALPPATIAEFLRERVASWWIPDLVEVVDELPRTSVGKCDKRALRQQHSERFARLLAQRA